MLIVTTPAVEGRKTLRVLGMVSTEVILGANIFKDLFAGVRDIVGGRSAAYEGELRKARKLALQEMADQAKQMGANAVVGADLDYESLTANRATC